MGVSLVLGCIARSLEDFWSPRGQKSGAASPPDGWKERDKSSLEGTLLVLRAEGRNRLACCSGTRALVVHASYSRRLWHVLSGRLLRRGGTGPGSSSEPGVASTRRPQAPRSQWRRLPEELCGTGLSTQEDLEPLRAASSPASVLSSSPAWITVASKSRGGGEDSGRRERGAEALSSNASSTAARCPGPSTKTVRSQRSRVTPPSGLRETVPELFLRRSCRPLLLRRRCWLGTSTVSLSPSRITEKAVTARRKQASMRHYEPIICAHWWS